MTATNKTTVYKLPIFVGTDKPTWLGDFNGAMNSIESGLVDAKNASTTVIQTANTALNIANQAETNVQSTTNAVNNAVALANTAKATATEAKTSATSALTTANNANDKADKAISVANAASASATKALTTVNGINTNPPAIYGISYITNDNQRMPSTPTVFAMTPLAQYGMTWVSASNGYRVDTAGVYLVNVTGSVSPSEYPGGIHIMLNHAGTISDIRYALCPPGKIHYTINVTSILALNIGDIITVGADNATFYGGTETLGRVELAIARIGA